MSNSPGKEQTELIRQRFQIITLSLQSKWAILKVSHLYFSVISKSLKYRMCRGFLYGEKRLYKVALV